jgi:hypothetical protein
MVPPQWQAEYQRVQELASTIMLNDLDPQNANGDAYRQAARERVFA